MKMSCGLRATGSQRTWLAGRRPQARRDPCVTDREYTAKAGKEVHYLGTRPGDQLGRLSPHRREHGAGRTSRPSQMLREGAQYYGYCGSEG